MFHIFIKRSEVVLDCFTFNYQAYELFKLDHGIKFIPNWWKELPKNPTIPNEFVGEVPTRNMRHCPGFIDYFKSGLILPLWTDMIINTTKEDFSWFFVNQIDHVETHPPHQHNNTFNSFHHLKIGSPWYVKCKDDIKFLLSSPFWLQAQNEHIINNFHLVPGIISLKEQHSTNLNVFLPKKDNRFFLEAGFPLVYFLPQTEKKIKLKHHYVSENEFREIDVKNNPFSFAKTYNKRLKILKKQNNE